ncbi:Tektin-4 [Fasciolopsis buskii]|uniref:Tektin n=1 Tax=Fasciolopsis buskii TaxID=27845 RepID=A0A8E0S0F5_9TREM|nr:Tektin-4 [Fasciolopsis buski]
MPAVDFRNASVTPQEWERYHRNKYDMAFMGRKLSEEISQQSKNLIKTTDAITDRSQEESTKQLKGRVHDILFWKTELEKEIHDMITENDLLLKEKRRLENALLESEIPFLICTENLNTRGQRGGIDHVVDEVDREITSEHMSDPETWAKAAQEVIVQGEMERKSSAELRTLIKNLLNETSRDLRHHHDLVCRAFERNIERMIAAKTELENQLKQTVEEIVLQEENIERLKEAVRAKDDPLKLAQTRLHLRSFRPNLDLCNDQASKCLLNEVELLTQSLDELLRQTVLAENKLKDLQDMQIFLEKDLDQKRETIHLETVRCLPRRSAYPSALRLQGYP